MSRFTFPRVLFARLFRRGPALAIALWALAIAIGFRGLVEYEFRAGQNAAALTQWPSDADLTFDAARTNLVMFAHPQCPCSRASMAELAAIMTRCPRELRAVVCFFDPEEKPANWTQSALWRSASAIPGVEVVADTDGRLARRFASVTSGQVFLFDRNGRKIFAGGITGARGHEGVNRGRNFVIALARGDACTIADTPVFGCSLQDAPVIAADFGR